MTICNDSRNAVSRSESLVRCLPAEDRSGGRGVAAGVRLGAAGRAHPVVQQRAQRRRLLPLQLRDGQRHRGQRAGLPEERGLPGAGGASGAGRLLVHGPRRRAVHRHLHGGRGRLPAAGRAPAHAAAHPGGHPARARVQRRAPRGGRPAPPPQVGAPLPLPRPPHQHEGSCGPR